MNDGKEFHAVLRNIKAGCPDLHNAYGFLFSALSLVRSGEDLWTDARIEQCDLSMVFQTAASGLVAPLLFRRLQQKGVANQLPEDFMAALAAFYDANCMRNDHHRMVLLEAGRVLNDQGITPILLKGSHALVGQLPDADSRIISDIDLLVPAPKTEQAHQILLQAGFFHEEKHLHAYEDSSNHHVAPLYHPSGNGYIELHRFPNKARYQPDLIGDCFSTSNLKAIDSEGVHFLGNTTSQLLIYNQIHHYYSALRLGGHDRRHLAEQAALCYLLNSENALNNLQSYVNTIAPSFSKISQLQLALVEILFGQSISGITYNRSMERKVKMAIELMLKNSNAMKRQRFTNSVNIVKYGGSRLFDQKWFKDRVFNLEWYKALPQKISNATRYGLDV